MVLGAKILISQMAHDTGEYPFKELEIVCINNILHLVYLENVYTFHKDYSTRPFFKNELDGVNVHIYLS